MREIYISCSCGGGASVKIPLEDRTAITECACGKMLLWSAESALSSTPASDPPATLSFSVSEDVKVRDKFM